MLEGGKQNSDDGVSVIVLDSGRPGQLAKLIKGLEVNEVAPAELIFVRFSNQSESIPPNSFPIVEKWIHSTTFGIPYSAGRNLAAANARGQYLVFIGLDCIPSKSTVADYADGLASDDNLWLGQVTHLHDSFDPLILRDGFLESLSQDYSGMGKPDESDAIYSGQQEKSWSLSFGIRKSSFEKMGGFDERYVGFGGEDLDFMVQATCRNMGIGYLDARVWHQFRTMYHIPTQNLESIVRNARIYREKWGYWPTKLWLEQLAEDGFVNFDPDKERLEILSRS